MQVFDIFFADGEECFVTYTEDVRRAARLFLACPEFVKLVEEESECDPPVRAIQGDITAVLMQRAWTKGGDRHGLAGESLETYYDRLETVVPYWKPPELKANEVWMLKPVKPQPLNDGSRGYTHCAEFVRILSDQ